ncbi:MAG: DNA-binding protein [Bacteroidetes bacterium]|nr:DNA-binding protein [Bacteroidota bacterium]
MITVVSILLFGAMIFLVVRAFRMAIMGKGAYAEDRVARRLARLPKEYHVFNDVYIRSNKRSVQIDHIVISRYGVFVIETKNYKGWVYGSANAEHWTQNIYGHKYQLYNPTRQNSSHVGALCNLFRITRDKTIPLIVFAGSATVHCSTDCYVVYLSQLRQIIDQNKNIQFTDEQVMQMVEKLSAALVTDKNSKREHVRKVRQQVAEKEQLEANGICPRCHGQLVMRKGRYGHFIGCSNYPNCKYTAQT